MTKPKRDLSDPKIIEAVFLAKEETSDRTANYLIDIDGGEVPVCRFVNRDSKYESIMMPFSKHNTIVIMPFFKRDEVNGEYEVNTISSIYNVINNDPRSGWLDSDESGKYLICGSNFVNACSLSGVVILRKGECPISGANTVWCLMLPKHLKGLPIKEIRAFFAKYSGLLIPPNMALFDLPDTATKARVPSVIH